MTTEGRPVRLIVDGWATTMTDSHGNDTQAVRVRYEGAERAASVLVLTSSPNVTLEEREARRTWTDGDVAVNTHYGWTLTRHGGKWVLSVDASDRWQDADVNASLSDPMDPYYGELVALRYQAGA